MKYILLALVSILTLGAISLFVFDLMDHSTAAPVSEPAAQEVNKLASNSVSLPGSEPKVEPNSEVEATTESCDASLEATLLELQQAPQSCQRHEDCQLKTSGQGCGTFAVIKANGLKIDDWLNQIGLACTDALRSSCTIAGDAFKYQALCIKAQCVKSKVIELKSDPKEFTINTK